MQMKITSGVLNVEEIVTKPEPPVEPPVVEPPLPARLPFFSVGEATGKAGETVEVSVQGGCVEPMLGFDVAGGVGLLPDVERSGYGNFKAVGVELGAFLRGYLREQDASHHDGLQPHDHYWSLFQWVASDPNRALPEEWYNYAIGFMSFEHQTMFPPIPIPGGTELYKVRIEILPETQPGEYVLTCKDEHFYTQAHQRRKDLLYADERQGLTKLETFDGKLIVVA